MMETVRINQKDLPYLHQLFSTDLRLGVNFYDECFEYIRGYLVDSVGVFLRKTCVKPANLTIQCFSLIIIHRWKMGGKNGN
jgi:hypothetical protein